ncbi:MAG: alpha/beta hydrolase [bacterium]|nr:alpha/beta hydrolase [bacterium]
MTPAEIQSLRVQANGLNFHVRSCGEGDRLALFLHGFPENSYSWRYQMPALAELGFRAWAPDLRGYGTSDKPGRMEDYAIETLMDDVAGLIDASGAKSTLLLSHDWGGAIAWYFAMRRIRPLERLVIMNLPHPAIMTRVIRSGMKQRLRSWYAMFFQLPRLPEFLLRSRNATAIADMFRSMAIDKTRFPDEVLDVYRQAALEPGALTPMINYYRAVVRGGGARRQESLGFPKIEVPTLMIWGEEDAALDKTTTYGTDEFVSNLTLRYLPDVSHWVQQEAPETVNALLAAWLQDREVPECGAGGKLIDQSA